MIPLDDRGEVGDAPVSTDAAQDTRGRPELDDAEVTEPDVRDDRVEHELRHVVGMRERVPLADVRAVRDAVEGDLVDAERPAERVDIGDHIVGPIELAPRAEFRSAGPHSGRGRWVEIRCAHLLLHRFAVEGAGAGPTLVEDDDPVLPLLGGQRAVDEAVENRQAGLAGAAGQHEQHAVRRLDVV